MFAEVRYYNIGDLVVRVYGVREAVEMIYNILGFRNFESAECVTEDINVILKLETRRPEVSFLSPLNTLECDGITHNFWADDKELFFEIKDRDYNIFIHHHRGTNQVEMTFCDDVSVMRFAMWVAYAMVAQYKGVTPIHASTIVHNGYALLSLGESGTGKSTHSRMWLENIPDCELLNDDSPLLRVVDDVLYAYGSPWSGKLHCYRSERFPIKSIARIVRDSENWIERQKSLHAIAALYPSLPPMYASENAMKNLMLDKISSIIEHVPVYKMMCRPDGEAALVNYNEVFNS